MIRSVTGFMFSTDRTRVALIAKLQPAWQSGRLNGVGGKIEATETPEQAMAREFQEETGVETPAGQWRLFAILVQQDGSRVYFLSTFDDRVQAVRSVEKEIVDVFDARNLPGNAIGNLTWLIPMALDQNLIFETPIEIAEVRDA